MRRDILAAFYTGCCDRYKGVSQRRLTPAADSAHARIVQGCRQIEDVHATVLQQYKYQYIFILLNI